MIQCFLSLTFDLINIVIHIYFYTQFYIYFDMTSDRILSWSLMERISHLLVYWCGNSFDWQIPFWQVLRWGHTFIVGWGYFFLAGFGWDIPFWWVLGWGFLGIPGGWPPYQMTCWCCRPVYPSVWNPGSRP